MKPSVDYIIQPLNVSHPSCEGLLIGIKKDIQVPFSFFKINSEMHLCFTDTRRRNREFPILFYLEKI